MVDKSVKVLLDFEVETQKTQAVKSELSRLSSEFSKLANNAKNLKDAIEISLAHGESTKELEQELKSVRSEMGKLSDQAKTLNKSAKQTFQEMRESAEKFAQVGSRLAIAGAAITAPFLLSANKYVQAAGVAESASSRWMSSMRSLEQSQMRVGRVTTDVLNPGLEQAARLAEQLSSALEKNPQLVSGVLGLGATLTTAGAAITGGAQIAGSLATLKSLQAGGGAEGMLAGGALKLGQVAMTAAAVYLSAEAGKWIGNEVNKMIFGPNAKEQTWGDIATTAGRLSILPGQLAANAVGRGGEYYSAAEKFNPALIFGNYLKNQEQEQRKYSEQAASKVQTTEQTSAFAAFKTAQDERIKYEQQAEAERNQIVKSQSVERINLEQNYGAQRSQAVAEFLRNEAQMAQDYYNQRSQLAKNYDKEVQRAEEDHQREMRRMLEEHNQRVTDLTASRDALGLKKENESYATQRQRAEEDYSVQARRRSQDFAEQLAQLEENYATQRQRREEEFAMRLEQMDEQHAEQMKKFDDQARQVLEKLDERNRKELDQLSENERTRARVLSDIFNKGLSEAESLAIQTSEKYLADFKKWIEDQKRVGSQLPAGGRAAGGYIDKSGLYRMAEQGTEFVLNNSATRAAERMMGRRLTQQDILAGMGGRNATIVNNISYPGGSVSEVKRYVAQTMSNLKEQIFADIAGAM